MNADLRCKQVHRRLPDYLEGELPPELRSDVDAHLDGCAECASEVAEMEATIRLLRGLPEPETPPMIAANVMRRIRTGETEPTGFERLRRSLAGIFEPSFVLPASAMAVAALVVVVVQGPAGPGLLGGGPSALDTRAEAGRSAAVAPSLEAEARAAAPPRGERVQPDTPMTVMRLEFAEAQGYADPVVSVEVAPTRRPVMRQDVPGNLVASANGLLASGGSVVVGDAAARGGASFLPGASLPGASPGAQPGRFNPRLGASAPRAIPVAGPAPAMAFEASPARGVTRPSDERLSAGGVDARDEWLAAGLRNPREFAHFLAGKSLAEQELWIERLAKRADERGLLAELVTAFEATEDETAQILADDFRAVVGASAGDFGR